ncbi:hypothetical protein [Thiohalorhabdus methylotrophus]|uniref:Uncharacterized protein n=1 Tax=Thiohalorhabdus methylotrophus TaxID=3242694 RepID=A0ABV4TZS5_9GAMM
MGKRFPQKRFLPTLSVAGCLLLAPSLANAGNDYVTTFTPKAGQAYQEDINVWVYTRDFAERFGMPEKWVSGKLEGAHAAAFRVERASARTMFPHKGEDVSKSIRYCILDLFLPSDADIPWANDKAADIWWYPPEAPYYLAPQREKDKQWQRRAVGLPKTGHTAILRSPEGHVTGLSVRSYHKSLYPGVDYISFGMPCTTRWKIASSVEFRPGGASFRNKEVVRHKVRLPKVFMEKMYAVWKARSRSPATEEWEDVIEQ